MTTMRMKKFTIIGLSLCAMLMGQGSGGSEDTEAAESGQGAAQPALSVSRIPRGMVLIPGGTISGINPIDKGEKRFTDYPATYNITVDEFLMDINLVTKRLWDWVRDDPATVFRGYEMSAGGGKEANHPVQSVCWVDAVKWMNARSELMGREPVYYLDAEYTQIFRSGSGGPQDEYWDLYVKAEANGYRLPTDKEWEYAARGGLQSKRFPWGDEINHDHANYRADGSRYSYDTSPYTEEKLHPMYNVGANPNTSPVGSFAANGYGLHDMSGNVWEWCFDWHPSYVGSARVLRGGSWISIAYYCRVAYSKPNEPYIGYDGIGFRAVLPLDPADSPHS